MKLQNLLGATALALAATAVAVPANAARDSSLMLITGITPGGQAEAAQGETFKIARQGRGRGGDDARDREEDRSGPGHGGDDRRDHGRHGADDDGGTGAVSGSGRRKPRVPGGSGCDDPGDVLEHPECRP